MNKRTLVYLGLGGIAAYYLFRKAGDALAEKIVNRPLIRGLGSFVLGPFIVGRPERKKVRIIRPRTHYPVHFNPSESIYPSPPPTLPSANYYDYYHPSFDISRGSIETQAMLEDEWLIKKAVWERLHRKDQPYRIAGLGALMSLSANRRKLVHPTARGDGKFIMAGEMSIDDDDKPVVSNNDTAIKQAKKNPSQAGLATQQAAIQTVVALQKVASASPLVNAPQPPVEPQKSAPADPAAIFNDKKAVEAMDKLLNIMIKFKEPLTKKDYSSLQSDLRGWFLSYASSVMPYGDTEAKIPGLPNDVTPWRIVNTYTDESRNVTAEDIIPDVEVLRKFFLGKAEIFRGGKILNGLSKAYEQYKKNSAKKQGSANINPAALFQQQYHAWLNASNLADGIAAQSLFNGLVSQHVSPSQFAAMSNAQTQQVAQMAAQTISGIIQNNLNTMSQNAQVASVAAYSASVNPPSELAPPPDFNPPTFTTPPPSTVFQTT